MIVECIGVYGERVEQALVGINRLRSHVDRAVVIVDESVTEEQRKMLTGAGCEVYFHPWEDSMVKMRNHYLEKVQTDDFVIVHDPDEWFNEEFCNDVRKIVARVETSPIDVVLINSHDTFTGADGKTSTNVSDFFKNLIYRKRAGTHYEGVGEVKEVHETLIIPGMQQQAKIDKKYWYEHVKYWHEVWERAARNSFMGGGGCVTPDSIIITSDGFKRAGQVSVGDLVINGNGQWTKVTNVQLCDYDEEVFVVTPFHGLPIGFSEAQKTLSMMKINNRIQGLSWVKGKDLHKTLFGHTATPNGNFLYMPNISSPPLQIGLISDRDFKKYPKLPWTEPDFWYFVGYWIADGSVFGGRTVELSINPKHEESLREMSHRIFHKKLFLHKDQRSCGYVGLRLYSISLARWLKDTFGVGAKKKKIPVNFLALPKESLTRLTNGLFDGDGTKGKTNSNSEVRVLRMDNSQVPCFAYLALRRLGELPSVLIIPPREDRYGKGEQWSIYVNSKKPEDMRNKVGKLLETGVIMPIREQLIQNFYGKVVDMRVAEGDSFVCPYVTMHNNNVGTRNPSWKPLRNICDSLGLTTWPLAREYFRKGNVDPRLKEWLWENRFEGFDFHHEMLEFGRWYFEYLHPEEAEGWKPVTELQPGSPPEVMRYVEECYMKVLGRHADQPGKEMYTAAILQGSLKREDLPELIKKSPEYQQKEAGPTESVKLQVPVDVNIRVTEAIIIEALGRSKTWATIIKPRLDVGIFFELALGEKWNEFLSWFYKNQPSPQEVLTELKRILKCQ